ncbi:MAG: hypothetical protein EAZ70_00670 [Runella slithyformis]|nr:MAG: hypothetical protein EAY79_01065 [Runella slithyformis]TAF29806.1 MAG: hypothetical protein EAZ70_00670 [Runella slithyformis]TAF48843.1 MAG: hypothetical protein EAZ63_03280 [Runella slithyformis]TAF83426.1 MAG: hypothetical protein EAZ50_01230 [Runella slithyformis]
MKLEQTFGTEELTSEELLSVEGGGWGSDVIEFVGGCIGTVIGGVLCAFKCISNHLNGTSPKPSR